MSLFSWIWPKISEDDLETVKAALSRWDPIGVILEDSPVANNEYDSYAPGLARLLKRNASVKAIARRLGLIRRFMMLLPSNEAADRRCAENLVSTWESRVRQTK